MSNKTTSIVVESSGFSDKKIKLDSLQHADGLTINQESIGAYFDRSFIEELTKDAEKQSHHNIGINHKPRLRYKPHKEAPGNGHFLHQSQINRLYSRRIMENLVKANAPQIKFVIAALLTGQTFTYENLQNYIKEQCGKHINIQPLQACISSLKNSPAGFLLEKVGKVPATWRLTPEATVLKLLEIYELSKTSGSFNVEMAIAKYPFIADIIKDKTGADVSKPEFKEAMESKKKKAPVNITEPAPKSDNSQVVRTENNKQPLIELLQASGGKFDINVNVNFRILFGKP